MRSRHIGKLQEQEKTDQSQGKDDEKMIETREEKPVTKEKRAVDLQPSRMGRSQSQIFLKGRLAAEKLAKLKKGRRQKNQDSTREKRSASVCSLSSRQNQEGG